MIYFDNAATGRPLKEATSLFLKVNEEVFANPSSHHRFGYQAKRILEQARADVLSSLGLSKTHECIFLSGASEANSMAIKSVALRYQNRGKRILTSSVEHPSVTNSFLQLRDSFGFETTFLEVNEEGFVPVSALEKELGKDVILVSLMQVNNETGAVFPIEECGEILRKYPKALFHVDATQGIGKVPCSFCNVDLISFSAHKFGGLKGSGCLLFRKNLQFLPLISGGEQEYGYRSGTVSPALAASLAEALKISLAREEEARKHVSRLCSILEEGLSEIEEVEINSPAGHSPFLCNFSLRKHKASVVVEALSEKGIYVSSVSACSSKGEPVSKVLLAMGKGERLSANSIRVSFSLENKEEEVFAFLSELKNILKEIKPL